MRTYYPITIEKLNYDRFYKGTAKKLLSKSLLEWQILQAACNCVTSYRLCGKLHFKDLNDTNTHSSIVEYLLNNFEAPTNVFPPRDYFSPSALEKQVYLDTKELLFHFGEDPEVNNQKKLQSLLKKHKLV